ncbi:hypothetical protein BC332_11258 [Capsicum chinense]|nr:hypothetical protein BC332_11258 [Capsicum chinense]
MTAQIYLKIQRNGYLNFFNFHLERSFSLWSMKKDPDLEATLHRNRRWIVNNQIKNIIMHCPNQVATVKYLQKKFKNLDLQRKALNWIKKYPCCFEVYLENDEYYCGLTKRMVFLTQEEEDVKDMPEGLCADRLAKLLMMCRDNRLNVVKLNELRRNFGFSDNFLLRIVPKYSEIFRVVNHTVRQSSMEIELTDWNPGLVISAIERMAKKDGREPCFSCSLLQTWVKSLERFEDFNSTPYISPYVGLDGLVEGSKGMDKITVGLVHELLSLTLWKKASIFKLGHFRREFCFPEKLNVFLLKHPGIFYVSNRYHIYTVLLRESYNGFELIEQDPLVVVKEKFRKLMQEGFHEYSHRHYLLNLEKKRNRGMIMPNPKKRRNQRDETSEQYKEGGDLGGIFDPEERKRFYRVLFDDNAL